MKKVLSILLAAMLLLSLAACSAAPQETPETNETTTAPTQTTGSKETTGETEAADTQAEGTVAINVTVVHADGSEKVFSYTTDEEFLGTLLQKEGVIKGEEGPYGLMISEVDGEKAVYEENGAYWALYENGEYAMQGVDTTKLTDGGEYKLEYTK